MPANGANEDRHNSCYIAEPHCGFQPGGGGREVEGSLENRAVPAAWGDNGTDIKGKGVEPWQHAGFLQIVNAVGENASGDDDENGASPREEASEIDTHYATVDEVTEHDRGNNTQSSASEGQR